VSASVYGVMMNIPCEFVVNSGKVSFFMFVCLDFMLLFLSVNHCLLVSVLLVMSF